MRGIMISIMQWVTALLTARTVLWGVLGATCPSMASSSLSVQLSSRRERSLAAGREAVARYCGETESLLSLLTQGIRTVQEAEIISRGYSR